LVLGAARSGGQRHEETRRRSVPPVLQDRSPEDPRASLSFDARSTHGTYQAASGWMNDCPTRGQIMPALIRPRLRRGMTFAPATRRKIQQFGPYKSLALLLVPLLVVEPVKMTGLAFVGLGHRVVGACMIVGAYAAGLLVVDRLFRVVNPNCTRCGGARCWRRNCKSILFGRAGPCKGRPLTPPAFSGLEAKILALTPAVPVVTISNCPKDL
jgi:hypothetical protein